jgi:pimeloyl-ACP methyl ester carboxylesterase
VSSYDPRMGEPTAVSERDVLVGGVRLHLRSVAGDGPPVLIVHGWPESSVAWVPILERAAASGRSVHAVDLPGVGGSERGELGAGKRELASVLGELAEVMGWERPRLVGHDVGGMIAYAALRAAPVFEKVAICNTVVPGVAPWDLVYGNPRVFHFHFHAVPGLPEALVEGRERLYFDWFLDLLSDDPRRIGPDYRDAFAQAYSTTVALKTGFDWYRALPQDAEDNRADTSTVDTPVLYLRGDADPVDTDAYLAGFRAAGLTSMDLAVIPHSGHSASLESPDALWDTLDHFTR